MLLVLAVLLLGMLVVSYLLARAAPAGTNGIGVAVTAYLVFGAATTIGAGLGFLFGLPRARLTDELSRALGTDTGSNAASIPSTVTSRYLANSNLIKVSDWVTTIVVGLALVNIVHVVPGLQRLGAALSQPLGATPYAGTVGLAIVIGGALAGFQLEYLWTSIRVRELLEEAENRANGQVPIILNLTVAQAKKLTAGSVKFEPPSGAGDNDIIVTQNLISKPSAPRGVEIEVTVKK